MREGKREREKYTSIREFAHLTVAMFLSKIICKLKLSVFKFCYCLVFTHDIRRYKTNTLTQHKQTESTHKHVYVDICAELLTSTCVRCLHIQNYDRSSITEINKRRQSHV